MELLCSKILKDLLIDFEGDDIRLPSCIASDSRKFQPGGVFVAVPGTRFDGHDFVPELESSASAVVHSRDLGPRKHACTRYRVTDPGAAAALLFRAKYGNPDESVSLFGVTGTNGKTSTAFLLEHILENCGLLSTVEYRNGRTTLPATHTTADPETFFRLLAEMRENHLSCAALELSSHALDQRRVYGAGFRAAVFTNLTQDHLDYHCGMEHYYQAKKRFFTELLLPDGVAVINTGDEWGRRLASELSGLRKIVTFSDSPGADWQITGLHSSREGIVFDLKSDQQTLHLSSNLIGAFNASNLTGAVLAALNSGVPFEKIEQTLQKKVTVPGRLQFAGTVDGAGFVVDFAHTDDALSNAIETLRPLTGKRLFCVFGAGGDRDKTKRPKMGRAASGADYLIVTSDNPRSEEPEEIIREIVSGIPEGTVFEVIPDRRSAILRAAELAEKGDMVLISGKGHEDYQEIKGVKYPFSDFAIIEEYFQRGK